MDTNASHTAALDGMERKSQSRASAMVLIDERLYQANELAGLDLSHSLHRLCEALSLSYPPDPQQIARCPGIESMSAARALR
jgi:two-component sensor histidine kinase